MLRRALALAGVALIISTTAVYADNVSNNLDATVDSTLEVMSLTVGGANGSVQFHLQGTGGDAKSGCNLTGPGSELVLGVSSSNTSVAALGASSITITACDPSLSSVLSVHPVAAGTATVTVAFTSVTTGSAATSASDYNLAPASFTVSVLSTNSAPNVDAGLPYSGNEGAAISLSGATASDSDGDALIYAWSINYNGNIDAGGSCSFSDATALNPTVSCNDDSNGATFTLTLSVDDSHGHVVTDTADLTVSNASPTATFNSPSTSVNEGSTFGLSLTAATDAGSNDTLQYAFDCGDGSGYGSFSATSSVTCTSAVDGPASLFVGGKVEDDDGAVSTYTGSVTVDNVKPTPTIDSISPEGGVACIAGNTVTLGFSWTDPATTYDTYSYDVNWGDAFHSQSSGFPTASLVYGDSPVSGLTHTYAAGTYTIVVTVNDSDTGAGNAVSSDPFSFLYNVTGVLQPVNDTQAHQDPSVFKYGSTIPVKIEVTDCDGTPVSGLAPQISVKKISGSTPPSGVDEAIVSTSGADTGTTMRWSDPLYIYNLATKSLTDSSATYQITITGPFPTVTALFGTKPK